MLSPTTLAILAISLTNVDRDSKRYDDCIYLRPCPHDGTDLKKLSKPEYTKEMECRVKRHMECIETETHDTIVLDPVYEYYKFLEQNK